MLAYYNYEWNVYRVCFKYTACLFGLTCGFRAVPFQVLFADFIFNLQANPCQPMMNSSQTAAEHSGHVYVWLEFISRLPGLDWMSSVDNQFTKNIIF